VAKRNGLAAVEQCPLGDLENAPSPASLTPASRDMRPESVPGTLEWCRVRHARIRFYVSLGAERVACSIDGGISYEAGTLPAAAQLCEDRLQRKYVNTGRVIRVPRG